MSPGVHADVPKLDVKKLAKICALRNWTISTAESCTGGLLSALIVAEPNVSSFFQGSIVCYSRDVKVESLNVSLPLILSMGEVSLPVARAMAQGVRKTLKSDWGIGITGVAGPTGGSEDKPVGTVCFAVVGPGFEETVRKQFKSTERRRDS